METMETKALLAPLSDCFVFPEKNKNWLVRWRLESSGGEVSA